MKSSKFFFTILFCLLIEQIPSPFSIAQEKILPLDEVFFKSIEEIIIKSIHYGKIPGVVLFIGNQEKILYRGAFGNRALIPKKLPMTIDTIFDLASLTKVVATTTAVMQLVEKGRLSLEDPVYRYWPEFKNNGKEAITIRHLLTHRSGLRAGLESPQKCMGVETVLNLILSEKPIVPPGTKFIYSDINFQILGELVRRISDKPLDQYCSENIFKPLKMKNTYFNPPLSLRKRIAPTQYQHQSKGKMLWGEVHDPTAYAMGGVAGHAGLFSTAGDLSLFAQMLLNEGDLRGVRVLTPQSIEQMTTPQGVPDNSPLRGLGWEIDPFSLCLGRGTSQIKPYGHTGFTGTSIWIDPVSKIFLILLANQVHPDGKGDVKPLREQITSLLFTTLNQAFPDSLSYSSLPSWKEMEEHQIPNNGVKTGIDVLKAEKFAPLTGLRIGLITNHTGIDSTGQCTIDLMMNAPVLKLKILFSPEHGLYGYQEGKVNSMIEPSTGLPVYSLYGEVRRPTKEMLKEIDAIVLDLQEAGVRFFTYLTTMGYTMEVAAKEKILFYVLDRPNPLTASFVQGPIPNKGFESFTAYYPLPIRHGMTMGELAEMFNVEKKIGVKLQVIKMRNYKRTYWYDETGLPWINPSPNLLTLTSNILYPGVAMVDGSNVSVGRGTDKPFELLGAPWIDGKELSLYLNGRKIPGVQFTPMDFTPLSGPFKNEICHGIKILLTDRNRLNSPHLGMEIASALFQLYPKDFMLDKILELIGSPEILMAIKNGKDPRSMAQSWQEPLQQFHRLRSKYLLY